MTRRSRAAWVAIAALLLGAAGTTSVLDPAPEGAELGAHAGAVTMGWDMRVTGHVVSGASRAALAGADVRVLAVTDKSSFLTASPGRTDDQGRFDLRLEKIGRPAALFLQVARHSRAALFEITPLVEKSVAANTTRIDVVCRFPK